MKGLRFVRYDSRYHLEPLFAWMNDPAEQAFFLAHSHCNSLQDFECWIQEQLKDFYHEFFVIETKDRKPIGIIYSYDHKIQDGHCKIAGYMAPEWRNGAGAMAALQMLDYLFCYYPLRRVYCDIYSYNDRSLRNVVKAGFEETGRLKEYRYYRGAYYDLILLTISREQFYKRWNQRLHPNNPE